MNEALEILKPMRGHRHYYSARIAVMSEFNPANARAKAQQIVTSWEDAQLVRAVRR